LKSIYTILLLFISGYSLYPSPNLDTAEEKSQKLNVLKKMRVITDGGKLLLREEPSTNSKIILKIDNGHYVDALEIKPEIVTINKKTGNWIKIIFDDKVGWTFGAYLRDLRKANINTLCDMLGNKLLNPKSV
jgi:uncharacterized protein YgiM (DUF1202 family)